MKNPEAGSFSEEILAKKEEDLDDDKTPLEEEVNPEGHLENLRRERKHLKDRETDLNQECIRLGKILRTAELLTEKEQKETEEEIRKLEEELDKVEARHAELQEEIQRMKETIKKINN